MSESTPDGDTVARAVSKESVRRIDHARERIDHCLRQLSDEQIWWRPQDSMNSIGNLILHLCGNIRQWIISGVGGEPDNRDRPREFAERGPIPKEELLHQLDSVLESAKRSLTCLDADQLLRAKHIQGFDVSTIGSIFDSIPHLQGHTQEIICLTRMQLADSYLFHWSPKTPEEGAGGSFNP